MEKLPFTILGIVGCRKYTNYEEFMYIVDDYSHGIAPVIEIVSGGATGIDTLAERYAKEHFIPFKKFEAKWGKGENYDPDAGKDRNILIVNWCSHLLAMPSKRSVGTYDTIRKAREKGIGVDIINI